MWNDTEILLTVLFVSLIKFSSFYYQEMDYSGVWQTSYSFMEKIGRPKTSLRLAPVKEAIWIFVALRSSIAI